MMLELEDLEFWDDSRALLSPGWLCLSTWVGSVLGALVVLVAVRLGTLGTLGIVKSALACCAIPCDSCG
jgi:hypothetical protein